MSLSRLGANVADVCPLSKLHLVVRVGARRVGEEFAALQVLHAQGELLLPVFLHQLRRAEHLIRNDFLQNPHTMLFIQQMN